MLLLEMVLVQVLLLPGIMFLLDKGQGRIIKQEVEMFLLDTGLMIMVLT